MKESDLQSYMLDFSHAKALTTRKNKKSNMSAEYIKFHISVSCSEMNPKAKLRFFLAPFK